MAVMGMVSFSDADADGDNGNEDHGDANNDIEDVADGADWGDNDVVMTLIMVTVVMMIVMVLRVTWKVLWW